MSGPNIDWKAIRPLSGNRDRGFEELCSQLASCESPAEAQFIRKGTPDAGVECYAVFPNSSEWAWQAKYFLTSPDAAQWKQVNESVVSALKKHPAITKYFVCMPIDLPDGRVDKTTKSTGEKKRTKSARDQWDEHVAKWNRAAQGYGREVEFVFWGSHELLDRLAKPHHVGRVHFWFDQRGFDEAWFAKRLSESLDTAGPRYTPEVHVDLPVAQEFSAFGRTEPFFDRVKALALPIREKLRIAERTEERKADPEADSATTALSNAVQQVLDGFGVLEPKPTGALPFAKMVDSIDKAAATSDHLCDLLERREREHEAEPSPHDTAGPVGTRYRSNPFRDRRLRIQSLAAELRQAAEQLRRATELSERRLLLLRGAAGTGKTHLLCDVAKRRIAEGLPTVLLMGQRFVSKEEPWRQVLQQVDLPGMSAEGFVGALEAAAQASGVRALIVLDAINEGAGPTIWPSHMPAFLAHVERSPWIGVVMAVRTSYEKIVVPEEVRNGAAQLVHDGFRDHEYDATKTFFLHYKLELPSTPLFDPEFRNPLFLKTLCSSLHAADERRIPRGLHGITAVFDLHLAAVNKRLATQLDFDPRTLLVRQAVEAVASALIDAGKRWLELQTAKTVVDALLPGRDFERSLYRGLVVEGVLAEDAPGPMDYPRGETVYVAYERFADHLVAKKLLDRHLDPSTPSSSFGASGGLAFINNARQYIAPGLLEALWVQVAERCGRELVTLAPMLAGHWNAAEAFRQSLVWRAVTAFSDETRDALNCLCRSEGDLHNTLEVLLTVAVLPEHPLNARFLDERLGRDAMADRDAWWSIYLHSAWGSHGAVDRLVDWASSLGPETPLEDGVVELAGIALAWLFTSSNRSLRDRATKALLALCSGRLDSMSRLVAQFSDVDDPYVTERVYAAAYGVAMRSHDPAEVGSLAAMVYEHVFASASPPAHILLRDYARGVVERALYLRSDIKIDALRIRPPYSSQWPNIPSEAEIRPFLPDRSKGSHDSDELERIRNTIAASVMDGDFASYVIGTNSPRHVDWLALTHEDEPWEPPPSPDVLRTQLRADLSPEERHAWDEFTATDARYNTALMSLLADFFAQPTEEDDRSSLDVDSLVTKFAKARTPELDAVEAQRDAARTALESILTDAHAEKLAKIHAIESTTAAAGAPPRLELGDLQRYILKRVFDLGWTEKRFGSFDQFTIGFHGRNASKPERIGKKYQWIAYHEILAFVSDRFQYRDSYGGDESDKAYEGPWQLSVRDIDPSCTLRSTPGGTPWSGHASAWWGEAHFNAWCVPGEEREWARCTKNLPNVEDLLCVTDPHDGTQWLNAQGYFNWRQRSPADRRSTDVDRGELCYLCNGYLIRRGDTAQFLDWAESVDFWGRWMPDPAKVHRVFLGEHAWSPAARYFDRPYYGDDGWMQPCRGCPVKLRAAALQYRRESSDFDCSVDEDYTLHLPVRELVTELDLHWAGNGANFEDSAGGLAAQDPTVNMPGPGALLLRADLMYAMQKRKDLTLCWAVLGEKRTLGAGGTGRNHPALNLSGAFVLGDSGVTGFVKHLLDDPFASQGAKELVGTYRKE
jgi:hypothetical protein